MHGFLTDRPEWQNLQAELADSKARAAAAKAEIERIEQDHEQAVKAAVSQGRPIPAAPNVASWPQNAGYFQLEQREIMARQRNLAAEVAAGVAAQLQEREAEVLAYVRELLPDLQGAAAELDTLAQTWNFLAGAVALRRVNGHPGGREMAQGADRVSLVDAVRAAETGATILGTVADLPAEVPMSTVGIPVAGMGQMVLRR